MKFQIVGIFRELTVYQNIRIPVQRLLADDDMRAARIEELLDLVGLARLRDVPAGIFRMASSSGWRSAWPSARSLDCFFSMSLRRA